MRVEDLGDDKFGRFYFDRCCDKRCILIKNRGGLFDKERVDGVLQYCRDQVELVRSESRDKYINWWVKKLDSCFVKIGDGGRLVFNYHIGGSFSSDYLRIENVCQKLFTSAYNISADQLYRFQKEYRRINNIDTIKEGEEGKDRIKNEAATTLDILRPPNIDGMEKASALVKNGKFKPAPNIYAAKEICLECNITQPALETLQGMVVPDSPTGSRCWSWMKEYFSLTGEQMPNSAGEVHLDSSYTKSSVYKIYSREMEEEITEYEHNKLGYSRFCDLWDRLFPFVKIRKFKLVSGKCELCATLSELRVKLCYKSQVKRIVDNLVLMHRSLYMNERELYYNRRRLAISHPQEFMSIITDGMAQVHCELPWQANKTSFPKKLTQHLQGVLEHGQTISIFRTFENVGTGSNLGIHCLLSVLENRIKRDGKLPDTIFIQIDGGVENTAKIFLALCELIVAKGLTKKIILSRLPVGHTHEDIDGIFARIWTKLQNQHCLSPAAYRRIIMEAINTERRVEKESKVYDVFAIPNYCKWFARALDKKFSLYAKEPYTQHQFSFEQPLDGVRLSDQYPLGVCVRYRRWAQDEAIEVVRDLTSASPVPLKAKTVESVWHYEDGSGISLFQKNPVFANELEVAPFNRGAAETLEKVLDAVTKKLPESCHPEWEEFCRVVPRTDDANEYVRDRLGKLDIPLQRVLFDGAVVNAHGVMPARIMRNRQGGNGEEADTDADGNIRRPRVKARATVITRDRKDIRTAEEKKGNNRARPTLVGGAKRSNGDKVNSSTDTKSAGPAGADKSEAVQNIQDTELDEWKEGKEAGVWGTDSVELRIGEESVTEITETVGGVEEQTDAKQLQTNTVVNTKKKRSKSVKDSLNSNPKRVKVHEKTQIAQMADADCTREVTRLPARSAKVAAATKMANNTTLGESAADASCTDVITTPNPVGIALNRQNLRLYHNNTEALLKSRVSVWYPDYGKHFLGTVTAHNKHRRGDKIWQILFDDGTHAWVELEIVLKSFLTFYSPAINYEANGAESTAVHVDEGEGEGSKSSDRSEYEEEDEDGSSDSEEDDESRV